MNVLECAADSAPRGKYQEPRCVERRSTCQPPLLEQRFPRGS